MKCILCKTDEKEVEYMLSKNDFHICDKCVLLLSQKLNEQYKTDIKENLLKMREVNSNE